MVTKIKKNVTNRYPYIFRRIISTRECRKYLAIALKKHNIKLWTSDQGTVCQQRKIGRILAISHKMLKNSFAFKLT